MRLRLGCLKLRTRRREGALTMASQDNKYPFHRAEKPNSFLAQWERKPLQCRRIHLHRHVALVYSRQLQPHGCSGPSCAAFPLDRSGSFRLRPVQSPRLSSCLRLLTLSWVAAMGNQVEALCKARKMSSQQLRLEILSAQPIGHFWLALERQLLKVAVCGCNVQAAASPLVKKGHLCFKAE